MTNHNIREVFKYVYSDYEGPTKTTSFSESHYFVSFVDNFSKRVWVYIMRAKNEILKIFVKLKKLAKTQAGRNIIVLRYDNRGEYTSDLFSQICQSDGVQRHFIMRRTLQQNSVAEHTNCTLLEKV